MIGPMEVTGSTGSEVVVRLTGYEALVLADALSTAEDRDALGAIHDNDPALRQLLWDLVASFEAVVDEAFASDYDLRVERARRAILAGG